jgi:integrin alpha FG-GAP repeat containing protein 1
MKSFGLPNPFTSTLFLIICLSIIFTTTFADYKLEDYGLGHTAGTLAALGDFDSDKHTDLFVVRYDNDQNLYIVDYYRWTGDKEREYQLTSLTNPITSQDPIYNVILGDFNYDGRLDVLITGPDSSTSHGEYFVKIFFGDAKSIISVTPFELTNPAPVGQVSSMSISGGLLPDLFGMYYDSSSGTYRRCFWSFVPTGIHGTIPSDPLTSFTLTHTPLELVTNNKNPKLNSADFPYLATGFAPILGDFNGDCGSDLLLVTTSITPDKQQYPGSDLNGSKVVYDKNVIQFDDEKQIEIWQLDRSSTEPFPYVLHSVYPAYLGMLQPSVGDFDKDGALDLIIPYCYPFATCDQKNTINIFYNKQRTMCTSLSLSSSCRTATNLCVADTKWELDYIGKQTENVENGQSFRVTDQDSDDEPDKDTQQPIVYKDYRILSTTPNLFLDQKVIFALPHFGQPLSLLNLPFRLTVTDLNLDGDLDVAFLAYKSSSDKQLSSTQTTPVLQNNIIYTLTTRECKKEICFENQIEAKLFVFEEFALPNLEKISAEAHNLNFGLLDFRNSGSVDMIIVRYQDVTDPGYLDKPYQQRINHVRLLSLKNNFFDDSYFLTLLGGNGMCHSWCNGLEFPSPKPYGVSQSGLVFKFTVTALNGSKAPRIFMQGAQTAYSPLFSPYQVIGLGRTSNYIEELFLGAPTTLKHTNGQDNSNLFQAMIPNSQIVVFPYPLSSPLYWRIELFISPTDRLLAVFIAFIVTTAACCLVILILHLRERFAEEKLKKQRQKLFAF